MMKSDSNKIGQTQQKNSSLAVVLVLAVDDLVPDKVVEVVHVVVPPPLLHGKHPAAAVHLLLPLHIAIAAAVHPAVVAVAVQVDDVGERVLRHRLRGREGRRGRRYRGTGSSWS